MITRFLCEFAVFYHLKIVVSVSKSNPKIPSTINSHTCYFAIPINHNKQTSNTVADGGHGGKPTERVAEGFPRVAFL